MMMMLLRLSFQKFMSLWGWARSWAGHLTAAQQSFAQPLWAGFTYVNFLWVWCLVSRCYLPDAKLSARSTWLAASWPHTRPSGVATNMGTWMAMVVVMVVMMVVVESVSTNPFGGTKCWLWRPLNERSSSGRTHPGLTWFIVSHPIAYTFDLAPYWHGASRWPAWCRCWGG